MFVYLNLLFNFFYYVKPFYFIIDCLYYQAIGFRHLLKGKCINLCHLCYDLLEHYFNYFSSDYLQINDLLIFMQEHLVRYIFCAIDSLTQLTGPQSS